MYASKFSAEIRNVKGCNRNFMCSQRHYYCYWFNIYCNYSVLLM